MAAVLQFYQSPALSGAEEEAVAAKVAAIVGPVKKVHSEFCYYVDCQEKLSSSELERIQWILTPNFESKLSAGVSSLRSKQKTGGSFFVEIGPRLNFSTALSTNAVSICTNIGLADKVGRIEKSTLYLFELTKALNKEQEIVLVEALHDRMTEQRYSQPITSFALPASTENWYEIDVIGRGEAALREVSEKLGLSFDDWDVTYYCGLFRDQLKRNPTSVECFDLAQSNSEHSRHWFFKGQIFVDGQEVPESLIDMVASTQATTNDNNVIKFNDNSSAIKGFTDLKVLLPKDPTEASFVQVKDAQARHIIFTAETHNFPTGVAPFPGATTGTGGRIRDVQAAGRGAHVIAGTAGYSFGNLNLPGYDLEWEKQGETYPSNFASPAQICIEASNGASDYGNKFGEPVLSGFCRSYGQRNEKKERIEYIKPIMFSGGIGTIDATMVKKNDPEVGMVVAKVGGPVYRIGVGGGAASSTEVQGAEGSESLDFGAVQRGDAEMEQKMNRLIRACIECEDVNVIESIHDQGAGGNGNVLKEICEPKGAKIYCKNFTLGDPTINTMELWGAEYQESNAILVSEKNKSILDKIGRREKCQVDYVGHITGDEHITLIEDERQSRQPVHLSLESVLGSMPRKKFAFRKLTPSLRPLAIPASMTVNEALNRVLRLPAVASKRFLTTKVDRCVTGLVAQQQCVGPLHTPLADYAMIALNYFTYRGSATSIGEQPIKGLISPAANGRLSVAEAVTNLMFAVITELADVKCSGNWMWPAKLDGEGALLVETCQAMVGLMKQLNIAIDGGKDSLSMAAKVKTAGGSEVVKSPGTLVISAYAPVPDIRVKVTPVMKANGTTGSHSLVYANLSGSGSHRLGGSAFAQVMQQVGDSCPDIDSAQQLKSCFNIVQSLIKEGVCTAGHDVSDGGLVTCLLEMAFATNCGLKVDIKGGKKGVPVFNVLFAEEAGVVVELRNDGLEAAMQQFKAAGVDAQVVGAAVPENSVLIAVDGVVQIKSTMTELRDTWEATTFALDKLQANPACVQQEQSGLKHRKTPKWQLTFDPKGIKINIDSHISSAPRVVVLREEGINGDREMIASLFMVGFEVADVTVTDLISESISLEQFRGVIFPGGFSYADVLGSARGWAATLKFNGKVEAQLERFKRRSDTFSLGVCNGCQLMALLGWVGAKKDGTQGTMLEHNESRRFECRFTSVLIPQHTPAIMLAGMQGSALGVWVAHGEGRFVFESEQVKRQMTGGSGCVSLQYVDDEGKPTMQYPMNPNGSEEAIAGICSEDGRHLAMMPHPERATLSWQWPYVPENLEHSLRGVQASPWAKMFENAYQWVLKN